MVVDGRKPKGHYLCGCGCGVHVARDSGRCSAKTPRGHPCGRPPRLTYPVELCHEHLTELVDSDDPALATVLRNAAVMLEVERDAQRRQEAERMQASQKRLDDLDQRRKQALVQQSVVYYVKVGQYIKIGTTTNMRQRMLDLAVDAVLATEPGGRALERQRHQEFADLRAIRNEYFWPEDRLLDHIEQVRHQHGHPVMTGCPRLEP
jgi:hypothetical protein